MMLLGQRVGAVHFWLLTFVFTVLLADLADASTAKFESWYPLTSKKTYSTVSSETCAATLRDYHEALRGTNNTAKAATCSWQQRCILQNLRADLLSRMSSASVLLGLIPGLIASISPSVTETSILSTQKPVLSILIALGCPTVYPSRVLEYENAQYVLHAPTVKQIPSFFTSSHRIVVIGRCLKYFTCLLAIGNVFYTSWELGRKTVLSFICVSYNYPLIWTFLSVLMHLFASLAFTRPWQEFRRYLRSRAQYDQPGRSLLDSGAKEQDVTLKQRLMPTNRSIILNYISTFLGYLHIILGVAIFSSLLFIEILDVVTVILRLMASTLVSRSILQYELDRIRWQEAANIGSSRDDEAELQNLAASKKPRASTHDSE